LLLPAGTLRSHRHGPELVPVTLTSATLAALMRPRTLPHPTRAPASRSRPQFDKRLKEREFALQVD
jgi:hypothetical protein